MKWYSPRGTRINGTSGRPRHSAHWIFSVSSVAPVCSMSSSRNSAPAWTHSCGSPGVKNSNAIAPPERPPAASEVLTGLSRIGEAGRIEGAEMPDNRKALPMYAAPFRPVNAIPAAGIG